MAGLWRLWGLPFLACIVCFLGAFFAVEEKFLTPSFVFSKGPQVLKGHRDDNNADIRDKIARIESYCNNNFRRPTFDKLVFIVIDAFRADFMPDIDGQLKSRIPSGTMKYLEGLLKSQQAINFVGQAQTPTVTMPRIKAIMAGITPNFMDILYNINASHFGEDNFIEQAKVAGKKILFFGDDTWLHMFPREYFLRAKETFSFFATDYIQVDTNVTDSLLPELDKLNEWDMMILHYLGLDHIGHTFDAFSDLLPPKLTQMDNVVKVIMEKLTTSRDNYLVVVTGDHGMTDDGNHGGSSAPECDTSLIFISSNPNLMHNRERHKLNRIKQIDIAVTLSLLLGLEIPVKSNGKLIKDVFDHWANPETKLCSYFKNSIQLRNLLKEGDVLNYTFITALDLHLKLISKDNVLLEDVISYYQSFLDHSQSQLSSYETRGTIIGLVVQFIAFVIEVMIVCKLLRVDRRSSISIIGSISFEEPYTLVPTLLITASIIFLGSTDFIESEHRFWNSSAMVFIVVNLVRLIIIQKNSKRTNTDTIWILSWPIDYALKLLAVLLAIIITLITSNWSYIRAHLIDDCMSKKENCHFGASITIISFVSISLMCSKSRFNRQQCVVASALLFIYLYRCDSNSFTIFKMPFFSILPRLPSIFKARIVYLHIIILLVENFLRKKQINFRWGFIEDLVPQRAHRISDASSIVLRSVVLGWIILISLLVKAANIPLIALHLLLEKSVYTFFAMQSFFSQGNSNGVSTIEITPAFVGLDNFDPVYSVILIFLHTGGLFFLWILMMFLRVSETKTSLWFVKSSHAFDSISKYLLIVVFIRFIYFQIVAFILRNHLFIWSVISPKLLYEAGQCLAIFIITNIVLLCDKLT